MMKSCFVQGFAGKCFVFDKIFKNLYFKFINSRVLTLTFYKTVIFEVSVYRSSDFIKGCEISLLDKLFEDLK